MLDAVLQASQVPEGHCLDPRSLQGCQNLASLLIRGEGLSHFPSNAQDRPVHIDRANHIQKKRNMFMLGKRLKAKLPPQIILISMGHSHVISILSLQKHVAHPDISLVHP